MTKVQNGGQVVASLTLDTGFWQFDHVYFIKAGKDGPVKVGLGREPTKRLNDLQTASWETLRLMLVLRGGGSGVEQHLHKRFGKQHIRGEWYKFAGPVAGFYADCQRINQDGLAGWQRRALLSLALEQRLKEEQIQAFAQAA